MQSVKLFPRHVFKMSLFATLLSVSNQHAIAASHVAATDVLPAKAVEATEQAVTTAKEELQNILQSVMYFSADFEQEINDFSGQKVGEGTGAFSLLKPNYMHWETKTPDESVIIADGESVWLYDPFIEQASVYNLTASIANTPILLLTTHDKQLWDKFTVTKVNELMYNIVSDDINSQIKTLNLVFIHKKNAQPQKQLSSFSMEDASGQVSTINLSNVDYANKPEDELFKFTLPEGAYLDDQR